MKIIFHSKVLDYQGTLGNPQGLVHAYDFLKQKYSFVKPDDIIKEPTVHTKELVEKVKSGNFFDPDSPAYENIFDYAMLSINSAIKAQEIQGFSISDPPGHHAGKNFLGGFCYFNNIAEAVQQSNLKTLILDIDGHHGNGTQDIFEKDKDVFYISLHRSPLYPGTGLESKNNIINKPLQADCGEETYLKTLNQAIQKSLQTFKPAQIAVSAGFDTYAGDLASLGLNKDSYRKIAKMINELAEETNSKTFGVLEGGYTKNLGELIDEFVRGFEESQ